MGKLLQTAKRRTEQHHESSAMTEHQTMTKKRKLGAFTPHLFAHFVGAWDECMLIIIQMSATSTRRPRNALDSIGAYVVTATKETVIREGAVRTFRLSNSTTLSLDMMLFHKRGWVIYVTTRCATFQPHLHLLNGSAVGDSPPFVTNLPHHWGDNSPILSSSVSATNSG